jgi:hypothetical protein
MDTTQATAALVSAAVTASPLPKKQVADGAGIAWATFCRKLDGHSPFNVKEIGSLAVVLEVDPLALLPFPRGSKRAAA